MHQLILFYISTLLYISTLALVLLEMRGSYWHKAIMEPFSAALCNDWYHGVPRSARCPAVSVAICCRR